MLPLLSQTDQDYILDLAQQLTGARLSLPRHSIIIQNVQKRMETLQTRTLTAYLQRVEELDSELAFFVSAVTIHTTSWFREPRALEFMFQAASEWAQKKSSTPYRFLSIACSTGEEVWSAACLLELVQLNYPHFIFELEGWDIDSVSLALAEKGTYHAPPLQSLPEKARESFTKNFLNLKGEVQIPMRLTSKVKFKCLNINEVLPEQLQNKYDFIFCRNMLIYYDLCISQKILSTIHQLLSKQGFLALGLSETYLQRHPQFQKKEPAIYQKTESLSLSQVRSTPSKVALSEESGSVSLLPEVLILEDDESLKSHALGLGKILKFQFFVSDNPENALHLYNSKAIGLVLCSTFLKKSGSTERFCQQLRKLGYKGNILLLVPEGESLASVDLVEWQAQGVFSKKNFFDGQLKGALVQCGQTFRPPPLKRPHLILLGASTGGTETLSTVLQKIPKPCPPVMVVQHMSGSIMVDFALRLSNESELQLSNMESNSPLLPNTLYIAQSSYHIGVRWESNRLMLDRSDSPHLHGHRPAVDHLFESAARLPSEENLNVVAALLTGMGRDGATGLLKLKMRGFYTLVQSEESCVVFGMPKAALEIHAAHFVGNPEWIRNKIITLIKT